MLLLVAEWLAAKVKSKASVEEWRKSAEFSVLRYQRIEREVARLVQLLQCCGCSARMLW